MEKKWNDWKDDEGDKEKSRNRNPSPGTETSEATSKDTQSEPKPRIQVSPRDYKAKQEEADEGGDADDKTDDTEEENSPTQARRISDGFKINSMNMKDGHSGRLLWESNDFDTSSFAEETQIRVPREILQCRAVAREINFSSREEIFQFRIHQRVFFHGALLEEWKFEFGFVIPGSTNNWQQIIEAAPPSQMLDPSVLSGNVVFETSFFDGQVLICKSSVRIFYV